MDKSRRASDRTWVPNPWHKIRLKKRREKEQSADEVRETIPTLRWFIPVMQSQQRPGATMTHGNYESSTRDLSLRTRNRFPSQSNESTGNSVTTTIMNHTQPPKAGERISKKGPRPRETKEASVQRNVETNGLASPEYQTSPCAKPERSSFTFRQRTPPNTARSVETGASPSKK